MKRRHSVLGVKLCALGLAGLFAGCGFNRDDDWIGATVVTLDQAPPALHGGTLLVLEHGMPGQLIVGDPDRDRLVRVELASGQTRELHFERGLELGRLVEDAAGVVYVVARRGGAVVAIEPESMTERARHAVCDAPRGLAWQAEGDKLHVACADGTLVTLGADRAVERSLWLGGDLRDVTVTRDGLLVSRFRSAETVHVDAEGRATPHTLPPVALRSAASTELTQRYAANTAVRLVGGSSGTFVLHQRARVGAESVRTARAGTYSYSSRPNSDGVVTWQDPCGNAVAHVTVSPVTGQGDAMATGAAVPRGVTPVDMAVSSGGRVALAFAGDPGGRYSAGPQVIATTRANVMSRQTCLTGEQRNQYPGQVVSVAFSGETLVTQVRDPAMLVVESDGGTRQIALGGEAVTDTGHQLFHMDLGGTISCATCHPGGGDDGHVWTFMATGSIRTSSLEGVVGLAPYHRAGDVPSFAALLRALEPQMDAPPLEGAHTDALEHWLESVPLAPRGVSPVPTLAAEGEALFARQGCAGCHSGELGSDRRVHEVAGERVLTAPLSGLAARAPYLRDGRASTIDEALGEHGLSITLQERSALAAYLETR